MRIKQLFISLSLLLVVFSWDSSLAMCSQNTYTITEEQLTTLETQLIQLENNNNQLLILLDESSEDLKQAKENSLALEMESRKLKSQLEKSQATIQMLQTQLTQLKNEINDTKNSLEIANRELENASISFKQYEQERARIEGRLTAQRTIWQVLFVIATGVAIAS